MSYRKNIVNKMVIFMKNIVFLMSLCSLISIQNASAGKTEKADKTDFEFKKPGKPYRPKGISKPNEEKSVRYTFRTSRTPCAPMKTPAARQTWARIAEANSGRFEVDPSGTLWLTELVITKK